MSTVTFFKGLGKATAPEGAVAYTKGSVCAFFGADGKIITAYTTRHSGAGVSVDQLPNAAVEQMNILPEGSYYGARFRGEGLIPVGMLPVVQEWWEYHRSGHRYPL